jgi:hypothetical protein
LRDVSDQQRPPLALRDAGVGLRSELRARDDLGLKLGFLGSVAETKRSGNTHYARRSHAVEQPPSAVVEAI